VTFVVRAEDLRPIALATKPKARRAAEHHFLLDLQTHLADFDLVVRLGAARDDLEPVLTSTPNGEWFSGRYIGDIRMRNRTLRIIPRVGEDIIAGWLEAVTNLIAVPDTSATGHSDVFVARLLAILWCRAVDQASRHGPPSFRAERTYEGLHVRGALDVRGTAALRARGSVHLRSTARFRNLNNDVARTLVLAERTLTQHLGSNHWRTPGIRDLSAQLVTAVGARPRLPTVRAVARQRYTPITRPYREVALFSHRIASQLGTAIQTEAGPCEGLLLDVAELWELFLLRAVRGAFPNHIVEHGAPEGETERTYLLSNPDHLRGIGRLKPDILVRRPDRTVCAVIDAKYKPLAFRHPDRIDGVDRADLYQLTSYLSRFGKDDATIGALLYPDALLDPGHTPARAKGVSWSIDDRWKVRFETVPVTLEAAVPRLRELLALP